ncbi:beta-galactosidase [Streptomyces sp. HNM0574]|uniref:beta-galactosidase n=1 Tax=Streptomyces sp. HNM0574 TaxID=2714954 RepID=UPI00146B106B|nr:beta-galactosidase [Streptomyces sp. HNM0574]NLU69985.1 beta-galactosidase [Streptomyces sp. HNM0574]
MAVDRNSDSGEAVGDRRGRVWSPGTGGLLYGGDYNPEQWPEPVWAEDLELMREAGVSMVTAGIFSWAKAEPSPGRYEFGWFDRVMDGLAGAGVRVCLATMTASPPPWLSHAHPETLPVDAEGVRKSPGSRQHYCPSSPVYREHAARLVERLATRYADHPALAMWHIGNEYGCHTRQCFCEVSAAEFRRWLRERYGTVEELNTAWSTAFWSQAYGSFAQVLPPRAAPTFPNPAHQLDYLRFSDEALLGCYLTEKAVLDRVTPHVPVTTNVMPNHKPVNAFAWAAHQDVLSLDYYQDPHEPLPEVRAGYTFDLMRSAGGGRPWLLLEQAPGAVNWRPRNGPKAPGLMRLWSWQAVAQGADAVLFFQWRQSLGGAEKYHSAMVPHGGRDTRIFREVTELGRELASVPEIAGSRSAAEAALLLDWDSWRALELAARPSTLNQTELSLGHYRPLFEAGVACDVLPPDADLTGHRLLVAPNLYLLSERDAEHLTGYVTGGGHLLVSFFSGIVDPHDRVHPGGHPGVLRRLLGLRTEEFWPLAEDERVTLEGRVNGRADLWSEAVEPEGAEVLAVFGKDHPALAGRPAVTRHRVGAGTVWYLATRPEPRAMRALMDTVRAAAGVEPVLPGLPDGVQATRRERADGSGGFLFLLNHSGAAAEVALPEPMTDLLTPAPGGPLREVRLEPSGVAVLSRPGTARARDGAPDGGRRGA